MTKNVLIQFTITCITLGLLLAFAFGYQTIRNQDRIDSRFELSALLFGAEGKSNTELEKQIETIEEFLDTFKSITEAYYDIPYSGSGVFMHYTYGMGNETPLAPILKLTFHEGYYGSSAYTTVLSETYEILENNPLGPFTNPSSLINESVPCKPQKDVDGSYYIPCRASVMGELFDQLISAKLSFSLFSLVRDHDGTPFPRAWFAEFTFDLSGHASVMNMKVSLDCVEKNIPQRFPVIICSSLLPLVLLGFLLRIRTFPRFSGLVIARNLHRESNRSEDTPVYDKPSKEGGWRWLGFISDFLVITFSITSLVNQFLPRTSFGGEQAATILLGFCTLINCVRLISILILFPTRYIVIEGFLTAWRQLFMYLVAIFPIMLGYSICGNTVFGMYGGYFGTIPSSIVTLICAMFGDNIIDTFLVMDQSSYTLQLFFGRLFIATFLIFFICNVLNIAHSIIQDSYTYAVRMHTAACREKNEAARGAPTVSIEELNDILQKLRG
ncbi:Polycystin cation channel [Trypanosoma melophagium]|uniref:Polycystin cation channel n=1 Tax=Trypanosoma melophagium TaxID=715481 RepID=UPI00351A7B68|nr:Polycystin cation channel [Trypanosoma melophagium]